MPGGLPDDKADVAYADDAVVVGDTSAVMGPVSATGAREAEGRFFSATPFLEGSMTSV